MGFAYIYLLQDGSDKNTRIYKVGRTTQKGGDTRKITRVLSYSPGTVVYNIVLVPPESVEEIEKCIKDVFQQKYRLVRGSEWFEGDVTSMKKDIDVILDAHAKARGSAEPADNVNPAPVLQQQVQAVVDRNKVLTKMKSPEKDTSIQVWLCHCGKSFSHQSNFSRHKNGNPGEGRKPCTKKKPRSIQNPSWLKPHLAEDQFPGFLSRSRIQTILEGPAELVASTLLMEIHLQPDNPKARPYCNVYIPNVKRIEVIVYSVKAWVPKEFPEWFRGFYSWVYRSWESVCHGTMQQQRENFNALYSHKEIRHSMEYSARSALLNSTSRQSVKQMYGFH